MERSFNIFEPINLTLRVEGSKKTFTIKQGKSEIVKSASGSVTVRPKHELELLDPVEHEDYESPEEILALLGMSIEH